MRSRALLTLPLVLAAALLAACGGGVKHSALAPRVPVDVLFATDRAPKSEKEIAKNCGPKKTLFNADPFGLSRASNRTVSYGSYRIGIPEQRPLGEILDFPTGKICLLGSEHPLFSGGPARQERDAFFAALRQRLDENPQRSVLVFIHGRNFRFDESVLWMAQLVRDMQYEGVPIVYSWPARLGLFGYPAEEDNIEWSTPQLKEFLEQVAVTAEGRPVHLLAHSMGNRALLRALRMMVREQRSTPVPKFGEVILAAPDVDSEMFAWMIPDAQTAASRITLYFSTQDSALGASEFVHSNKRAGQMAANLPGVESIEVDPKTDKSSRRHNYFVQNHLIISDISRILRDRVGAEQRGLKPAEGNFWRFAATLPGGP